MSSGLVLFRIDDHQYALPVFTVESIVQAVEITRFPKAPDNVLGAVNIRGQIIPVINLRRRLSLPEREIDLNDRLIIMRTSKRTVGIMADTDIEFIEIPDDWIARNRDLPGYISGVFRHGKGTVNILEPGELT